jgi:hypothetical protein
LSKVWRTRADEAVFFMSSFNKAAHGNRSFRPNECEGKPTFNPDTPEDEKKVNEVLDMAWTAW